VSEEHTASIFRAEDGDNMLVRNGRPATSNLIHRITLTAVAGSYSEAVRFKGTKLIEKIF
jgi:hypothetical protein